MAAEKTKHSRPILVGIGLIILFFAFLYIFKGLFVAASVNGEPISRFLVIKQLEKQGGKQTLDALVTKMLIAQEAKKRNIKVDQKDIDAEFARISKNLETQGTTLDQALAAQGMTKAELTDEIKIQLFLQKLVSSQDAVSEKEIDDYISKNSEQFPEGTEEATLRTQVAAQLKQQKVQTATQEFLDSLKNNSKTIFYVKY